jgi:glycerophosphoryl diester phosphodiesterase
MALRALDLPSRPWIVGHRGAAGEAPENSLAGLRLAVDQGADMVELDLQLAADGRLVAFHDWNLLRLNGRDSVVERSPWSVLRELELEGSWEGVWHRWHLVTLPEILQALPQELPLNCELKRQAADREQYCLALTDALGERSQVLLSSFDWTLLHEVGRRLPGVPVAPLAKKGWRALLQAAEDLSAFSVHCERRLAGPRMMAQARQAGQPVLTYTVNRPSCARRLLRRGVSGLITDHPGRLRKQLEAR